MTALLKDMLQSLKEASRNADTSYRAVLTTQLCTGLQASASRVCCSKSADLYLFGVLSDPVQ